MMSRFFSRLLLTIIKSYQTFISPVLPARCRYYPTCSEYGKIAIIWHGPYHGSWLSLKRICRCHPWGGHGIDFVPLPLYKFKFKPVNNIPVKNNDVSRETCLNRHSIYIDTASYTAYLNNNSNYPLT
ncbi:membrane protein insertion efficiency factor YidD [Psychrobacter sp.]|uniref:membrane protein insertion efficiency factor YidD n=1 Tax=Psychrobacter sp. TaxID=56811 RepID=UPI0025E734F8|nr:membrane protein insertion efficiency factor YidD [Psychrobacter sp.]